MYGEPPKESQFKPGESGNPNGRPKGKLTEALRELCEQPENKDKIIKKLHELASKGNLKAIQYILDRLDGKPKQTTEVSLTSNQGDLTTAFGIPYERTESQS